MRAVYELMAVGGCMGAVPGVATRGPRARGGEGWVAAAAVGVVTVGVHGVVDVGVLDASGIMVGVCCALHHVGDACATVGFAAGCDAVGRCRCGGGGGGGVV